MNSPSPHHEETLLTLSDFINVFKRRKRLITTSVTAFTLLTTFYTLSKPPLFTATASFKEAPNAEAGIQMGLRDMLLSGSNSSSNDAPTVMTSRKVLDAVVKNLSLQAEIRENTPSQGILKRIFQNFNTQYAHIVNKKYPIISPPAPFLYCADIDYSIITPLELTITFLSNQEFIVATTAGKEIGKGKLNQKFGTSEFSFTLKKGAEEKLKGSTFHINLQPIATVSENLKSHIKIESDKKAKNILTLKYTDTNRQKSEEILNSIMHSYQEHLKDENAIITAKQMQFLEQRRDENFNQQRTLMLNYAKELQEGLHEHGFTESDLEMRFLLEKKQKAIKQLDIITLSRDKFNEILNSTTLPFIPFDNNDHSPTIKIFEQLNELHQKRDTLSLAVKNNKKEVASENIDDLHKNLKEIKSAKQNINTLLSHSNNPPKNLSIPLSDYQAITSWQDRIFADEIALKSAKNSEKEQKATDLTTTKSMFQSYLNNLLNHYNVYERTLQERLAFNYQPSEEFHGIDLETTRSLSTAYSMECHGLEAEIKQNAFVMEQLEDPLFEVSSLSTTLKDPVCNSVIVKASALALELQDDYNRSPKEHDRIRAQLLNQKRYLQIHLNQSNKLLDLRLQLLKDKIKALQEITLELINEKISLIEKNLREYLTGQIDTIDRERDLITRYIRETQGQMSHIPQKWAKELLMKQNLEISSAALREMVKASEGKNIAANLEFIRSGPLDLSQSPILPNSPLIILFAAIGAFIGAFLSMGYLVVETIIIGAQASRDNLTVSGAHVSGALSPSAYDPNKPLKQEDLETLRRLAAFFPTGHILALIAKHQDYTPNYAKLLKKSGKKVLILPVLFNQATNDEGLLQYLEGKSKWPKIQHNEDYDVISSGGISRFGTEMVCTERFRDLYAQLIKEYHSVIAVAATDPCGSEAEILLKHFDQVALSVTDQKLLDLESYIKSKDKKVTFIMTSL